MLTEEQKSIIKNNGINIRVRVAGAYVNIRFSINKEELAGGSYFIELYTDKRVAIDDLHNIAERYMLPVRAAGILVFPKGKTKYDFKELDKLLDS
ncbi:MAG: hypothetical protein ARM1_0200 [Candidatus Micrarchaeota archaeon]|nr:MAG: hypothetical protein ARM1_0200 [Candidatus Micrarchaeota archaeon]